MPAKPKYEEYKTWLYETHHIDLNDRRYKTFYELNATRALDTVQQHAFFVDLDKFLLETESLYDENGSFGLLMGKNEVKLFKKPFESVINKSFRKNIAFNRRFPAPPMDGWLLPENWFASFDDLIRGTIVTKYIDAPEFLSSRMQGYATKNGLEASVTSRESDSGYYAYHFYLTVPMEMAAVDMNPMDTNVKIEIQITTQLQEILRKLTHGFYEELRLDPLQDKRAWKWDFQSPRFQASYLGHTLHLLEGVIVQLKNRSETKVPEDDAMGFEGSSDE